MGYHIRLKSTLAFSMWLLFAFQSYGGDFQGPVTHPTKSGKYILGDWSYTYGIAAHGSRSESRVGRLFFKGNEVKGELGNVITTPLGKFARFGDPDKFKGYTCGWIMTMTYDHPVWDAKGDLDKTFSRNQSDFVKTMKAVELQDILQSKD